MSDIKQALKPCPFCGQSASVYGLGHGSGYRAHAECNSCRITTQQCSSGSQAESIWNRRAESELERELASMALDAVTAERDVLKRALRRACDRLGCASVCPPGKSPKYEFCKIHNTCTKCWEGYLMEDK